MNHYFYNVEQDADLDFPKLEIENIRSCYSKLKHLKGCNLHNIKIIENHS